MRPGKVAMVTKGSEAEGNCFISTFRECQTELTLEVMYKFLSLDKDRIEMLGWDVASLVEESIGALPMR